MATVDKGNFNKKNEASVGTLSDGTTFSGLSKVQPVKVTFGNSSSSSDVGFAEFTITISSRSELVVTEAGSSTVLPYEVEKFDGTGTAWLWVYGNWDSDGSNQIRILAGGGDGTDYGYDPSTNTSVENPWEQTGINAELVYHFSGNLLDSSGNNRDGASNGGPTSGQSYSSSIGEGYSFDGNDDFVDSNYTGESSDQTVVTNSQKNSSTNGNNANILNNYDGNNNLGFAVAPSEFNNYIRFAGYSSINDDLTYSDIGNEYITVLSFDDSADTTNIRAYGGESSEDNTLTLNAPNSGDSGVTLKVGGKPTGNGTQYFGGIISEIRHYSDEKESTWRQAEIDANPLGGLSFFSFNGEQDITVSLTGNVTVDGANQQNVEVVVYNKSQDVLEGLTTTDSNSDFSIGVSGKTDEYYLGYFYDDGATFYASGETTNP